MTEADLAAALLGPDSRTHGPRFAIHRNNVTRSLIEALSAGFPMTRRLVGDDFFAHMALQFMRQHPPHGPVMMLYGANFPAFLSGFAPVTALPYLPDVAALEQALRESYHAADVPAISLESVSGLRDAHHLTLAPSLRLIRSKWPIWAIWKASGVAPLPQAPGTDTVVLRPGFDPEPHPLPPGGGAFLATLLAGANLGQARAAGAEDLDLGAVLTLLLDGKALISLS